MRRIARAAADKLQEKQFELMFSDIVMAGQLDGITLARGAAAPARSADPARNRIQPSRGVAFLSGMVGTSSAMTTERVSN